MSYYRLRASEIKQHRECLLQDQNYICGLCGEDLTPDDAVLDHCHKTGRIRRAIHRTCNILLGKIENSLTRNRISLDRLASISAGLIEYIKDGPTDVLHPSHLTPEEKKAKAARRAKRKRNG